MEITSKKYPITENNICVGNVPFVLNVHEVRSSSDIIIDFEQKFATTGFLVCYVFLRINKIFVFPEVIVQSAPQKNRFGILGNSQRILHHHPSFKTVILFVSCANSMYFLFTIIAY